MSMLSNNYNPLGYGALKCPPTDWRRPNYIDAYNKIIQRSSESEGIEYIDNSLISGVGWDSASDWCHFDRSIMKAIVVHSLWKAGVST